MTDNKMLRDLFGLDPVGRNGLPTTEEGEETKSPLETIVENYENPDSDYLKGFYNTEAGMPYDALSPKNVMWRPGENYDNARHRAQHWHMRNIFNPAGRLSWTTGALFLEGVSRLGALGYELIENIGQKDYGAKVFSETANSGLANFFKGMKQWSDSSMPIYQHSQYQDKNLIEKMMSGGADFWATDFIDTAAFSFSSMIPGGILAKLGTGTKVATGLAGVASSAARTAARAPRAVKALSKMAPSKFRAKALRFAKFGDDGLLDAPNLKYIADTMDELTVFTTTTAIEALYESKDVRDSILENEDLRNQYSAKDIERMAGEAAQNTFIMNIGAMIPSNFIEVGLLFNKVPLAKKTPASRKRRGTIFDDDIIIDSKTGKLAIQPTSKVLKKLGSANSRIAGSFLLNMASEGLWEENLQYGIQMANMMPFVYGEEKVGLGNSLVELANQFEHMTQPWLASPERQGNIALGALVGGASTIMRETGLKKLDPTGSLKAIYGDKSMKDKIKHLREGQEALVNEINESQDFTKMDIWQREPEQEMVFEIKDGKHYISTNGERVEVTPDKYKEDAVNAGLQEEQGTIKTQGKVVSKGGIPQVDSVKLQRHFKSMDKDRKLNEIYEALSQEPEKNKFALRYIQNEKLAHNASKYFDAGLGDLLFAQIDQAATMNEEALNKIQFTSNGINTQEELKTTKEVLSDLEDLHNTLKNSILPSRSLTKEQNTARRKFLEDRGARILSVDRMVQGLVEDIANQIDAKLVPELEFLINTGKIKSKVQTKLSDETKPNKRYDLTNEQSRVVGVGEDVTPHIVDDVDNLRIMLNQYLTRRVGSNPESLTKYSEELQKSIDRLLDVMLAHSGLHSVFADSYREVTKLLLSAQAVLVRRGQLFSQWRNIIDPIKGPNFYKNNIEQIERGDIALLSVPFNDKLTIKDYIKYETDKLQELRLKRKMDNIQSMYHGTVWKEMYQSGTHSLEDVLNYLVTNQAILSEEDIEMLEGLVTDIVNKIETLEAQKENLATQIEFLDFSVQTGDITQEEANEIEAKNLEAIEELNGIILEMQEEFPVKEINIENVIKKLRKIKEDSLAERSDDELRRMIAKDFEGTYEQVIKAAENDTFSDFDSVEQALKDLKNLKRIFSNRKPVVEAFSNIEGEHYITEYLSSRIKALEKLAKEIAKKLADKKLRILNREKFAIERLYNSLGISPEGEMDDIMRNYLENLISPEKLGKILTSLAEDTLISVQANESTEIKLMNPAYAYAIIDLIKGSEGREEMIELLTEMIREKRDRIANTLGTISDISVTPTVLNSFVYNPRRSLKELLSLEGDMLKDTTDPNSTDGYDLNPETSSLARYIEEEQLYDFTSQLETENRTSRVDKETVKKWLKLGSDAIFIDNLRNILSSDLSLFEFMNSHLNAIKLAKNAFDKKQGFDWPPTAEQFASLLELTTNVRGTLSKAGGFSSLSNWTYVKGPAGAGKTNVIIRWLTKHIPSLNSQNTLAVGHNKKSAETLHKSLKVTKDPSTIDELVEKFKSNSLDKDISLIVIDEIGGASYNQLINLIEAYKTYTATFTSPIAIVVMGDPNQITQDTARKPTIEDTGFFSNDPRHELRFMKTVSPLLEKFRSNNPAIVFLQDAFLNRKTKVKELVGKLNVRPEDIHNADIPLKGSYVEDNPTNLIGILKRSYQLNPDNNKVVVVANQAQKENYERKIKDALGDAAVAPERVEVVLVKNVQGATIEEVYVDLPRGDFLSDLLYNKFMYTAASRAVDFLYVSRVEGGKNVEDLTSTQFTEKNNEDKLASFDERIAWMEHVTSKLDELLTADDITASGDINVPTTEEPIVEEEVGENFTSPDQFEKEILDQVEKAQRVLDDSIGEDPSDIATEISKQEKKVDTDEDVEVISDDSYGVTEDEVDSMATRPPKDGDIGGSPFRRAFNLKEPQSSIFKPVYNDSLKNDLAYEGLENALKRGPVKAYLARWNHPDYDGLNQVVVLTEAEAGGHAILAVLREEEVSALPVNYDNISSYQFGQVTKGIVYTNVPLDKSNNLTISTGSSGLKYKYLAGEINHKPFSVKDIFTKWLEGMTQGGEIDLSDVRITFKVFNQKEISQYPNRNLRETLKPGLSYLEISGWKRQGSDSPGANQVIRLPNQKIGNLSEEQKSEHTNHIEKFSAIVEEFTKKLESIVGSRDIVLGTRSFTNFVYALSNLYAYKFFDRPLGKGKNKKIEDYLNPKHKTYGKLFSTFGPVNILEQDELMNLAKELDELIHGTWEKENGKLRARREHNGIAQKQFDRIARSNLYTILPNGSLIMLRDTKAVSATIDKLNPFRKVVGRTLLGYATPRFKSGYDPLILEHQAKHLERLRSKNTKTKQEEDILAAVGDNTIFTELRGLAPIKEGETRITMTQEELAMFLGEGLNSMRVPISRQAWNDRSVRLTDTSTQGMDGERVFNDYFASNFVGVEPTTLKVHFDNDNPDSRTKSRDIDNTPPPSTDTHTDEDIAPDDIFLTAEKARVSDPGRTISLREANELVNKYMPKTFWDVAFRWAMGRKRTSQENIPMKVLDSLQLQKEAEGRSVWGLFKDGILLLERAKIGTDNVYEKIVKHEAFHKILHQYMSKEERYAMYDLARIENPDLRNLTDKEVEEHLAIMFQEWSNSKKSFTKKLSDYFKKILYYLGFYKTYAKDINDLFNRIQTGYYSRVKYSNVQITIPADKLDQWFDGDIKAYEMGKNYLLHYVKYFYGGQQVSGRESTYVPHTFEEAVIKASQRIGKEAKTLEARLSNMEKDNPRYEVTKNRFKVAKTLSSNKLAIAEIINRLFPDVNIREVYTNLDLSRQDIDEELKKQVGLYEQIKENEDKNPFENVTKQVKQALSLLIFKDKNGNTAFVPYNQAYAILSETLLSIDTSASLNQLMLEVSKVFENHASFGAGKSIKSFVQGLLQTLHQDTSEKYVAFSDESTIIYDTQKLKNVTFQDPTTEKDGINVYRKAADESLSDFISRVQASINDPSVDLNVLLSKHKVFKANNLWNNMITVFRSLRNNRPMVGIRKYNSNGSVDYRYIENRMSGAKPVYYNSIQNALIEALDTAIAGGKNIFKEFSTLPTSYTSKNLETKKSVVKRALKTLLPEIKLSRFDKEMSAEATHNAFAALRKTAIDSTKYIIDVSGAQEFMVPAEFLSNYEGFARTVAAALHTSDALHAPTGYIRGDGKRGYAYKLSSYAMEVLKFAESNLWNRIGGISGTVLKNNLYYKGSKNKKEGLKIYRYIDHDAVKYEGIDDSAKLYKRESRKDWILRNIFYQFLGRGTTNTSNPSYIQSVYTISNKPNIVSAEVNLLTMEDARERLKDLIQQDLDNSKLKHSNVNLKKEISSLIPGKLAEEVTQEDLENYLNNIVDGIINIMFTDQIKLPSKTQLNQLYKKLNIKESIDFNKILKDRAERAVMEEQSLSQEDIDNFDEVALEKFNKDVEEANSVDDIKDVYTQIMTPFIQAFVYNNYIHSNQLNQLFLGHHNFYKNPYDVIKRMSIAFAPGKVGNVNDSLGMPKDSRIAVAEDLIEVVGEVKDLPPEMVGESFESADAAGYMLPEFWAKLKKSYGVESQSDLTLKPVYYGVDSEGIPRAIKYASFVLTDDRVRKFPALKKLRDAMRNAKDTNGQLSPVDQMIFKSAVKVGAPKDNTLINEDEHITEIVPKSTFVIGNQNLRIQLNPAHDTISNVTNPSQLTFFPVISEDSVASHNKLLTLNAEIINLGNKLVDRMFKLKNGKPTFKIEKNPDGSIKKKIGKTHNAVRKAVAQMWFDLPGSENLWSLITNRNISLDLPVLTDRILSVVNSMVYKRTVDFKLRGSKLVLMPEFGTYSAKEEKLEWRDKDGFTEVMIPQDLAEFYGVKEGDVMGLNKKTYKAFGYRLPSTGLHSALVLKVKKVIPTPEGIKNNVIIVPSYTSFNHGSDYDIDSLFVLNAKKVSELANVEFNDNQSINLGRVLANSLDIKYNINLVLKGDDLLNYNSDGNLLRLDRYGYPVKKGGYTLDQFLSLVTEEIDSEIKTLLMKPHPERTAEDLRRLDDLLGGKEIGAPEGNVKSSSSYFSGLEQQMYTLYRNSLKNAVVHEFLEILKDPKNRPWMELPISMNRLKANKSADVEASALDIVASFYGELDRNSDEYKLEREKRLFPAVSLDNPLDQMRIHQNTFSGNSLTGASANVVKLFAFVFAGAKPISWIDQNGKEYTKEDLKTYTDKEGNKRTRSIAAAKAWYWDNKQLELLENRREVPKLKDKLGININGGTYNKLSRHELKVVENEIGEKELVPNKVTVAKGVDRVHSIWETLDSIINAAIDNVKEQILYHLNITDLTSNQFFSMIGLGIPLPTAVRFMKQPIIDQGQKRRLLRVTKINELVNEVRNKLYEKKRIDLQGDTKTLSDLLINELDMYMKNIELPSITDENMQEAATTYYSNGENIDALSEKELILQLAILNEFKKLSTIGDAVFAGSRMLNVLRVFPSTYSDAKNVVEEMQDKIGDFGSASDVQKELKEFRDTVIESDEFKALENPREKLAFLRKAEKEYIENANVINKAKRKSYNMLMQSRHSGYVGSADKWPFENSNILAVPNVKSAVAALMKLVGLIESTIIKHSRALNKWSEDIVKDLNLVFYGEDNKERAKTRVKNEFMHYLITSLNLEFKSGEDTSYLDLSLNPNEIAYITGSGKKLTGFKAFVYNLSQRVIEAQKKVDNPFLQNLQISYDRRNKINRLIFTSDKNQDPMEQIKFKKAFEKLSSLEARQAMGDTSKGPYSKIQLDLIKYLVITSGTSFGRTNFSRVIPDPVYVKLSQSLDAILKKSLADSRSVDKSVFLEKLKDNFMLQFLLNNINLAPRVDSRDLKRNEDDSLAGRDGGIIYNIAIKNKTHNPIFVARNYTLYYKIGKGEDYSYYRRVGKGNSLKSYQVPSKVINNGYDINKVFNERYMVPAVGLADPYRLHTTYTSLPQFKLPVGNGDIIYVHSASDLAFSEVTAYRVDGAPKYEEKPKGVVTTLPLTKIGPVQDFKQVAPIGPTNPFSTPTGGLGDTLGLNALEASSDLYDVEYEKSVAKEIKKYADEVAISVGGTISPNDTKYLDTPKLIDYILKNGPEPLRQFMEVLKGIGIFENFDFAQLRSDMKVKGLAQSHFNRLIIGLNFDSIALDAWFLGKSFDEVFMRVVMHELVHSFTSNSFYIGEEFEKGLEYNDRPLINAQKEKFIKFREAIMELQGHAMSQAWEQGLNLKKYGFKNEHEFLAEAFSNPEFANMLKQMKPSGVSKKSIWDLFVEAIRKFILSLTPNSLLKQLGVNKKTETLYDEVIYQSLLAGQLHRKYIRKEVSKLSKEQSLELLDDFRRSEALTTNDLLEQLKALQKQQENQGASSKTIDYFNDKVEAEEITLNERANVYESVRGTFKRLTDYVSELFAVKYNNRDVDVWTYQAKEDFRKAGVLETEELKNPDGNGKNYTFTDREHLYKVRLETTRMRGRYIHAFMEYVLEKDEDKKKAILRRLVDISIPKVDENGRLIQEALNIKSLGFVAENIQEILAKSRINFDPDNPNQMMGDTIAPELMVTSELLGVGTMLDGLVEHFDGSVSIVDWKFGRVTSDLFSPKLMKYAMQEGLTDNKLNRAKLEVAIRAFALKESKPNISFKNLSINHLNKHQLVTVFDIELQNYLNVLSRYLKDNQPEVYEQANSKGLFNAGKYWSQSKITDGLPWTVSDKTIGDRKAWVEHELAAMQYRYTPEEIRTNKGLKTKSDELTKLLLNLESSKELNMDASDKDISTIKRWFGNIKDIDNKYIRPFSKLFLRHRHRAEQRIDAIHANHDEKLRPALKEYYALRGKTDLWSKPGLDKINALPLVGQFSKKDFYQFMWEYHDGSTGLSGWYMNMKDSYVDPKTNTKINLTTAQKDYRDFVYSSMKTTFDKVMDQSVGNVHGKHMRKRDIVNATEGVYEGFMPRIPMGTNELLRRKGMANLEWKDVRQIFHRNMTNFIEMNYENVRDAKGIPLKYYQGKNSNIIMGENHSFDVEKSYKMFTQSLIMKDEMDDVYGFSEGLKTFLMFKTGPGGGARYKRTLEWLDDQVIQQVLSRKKDVLASKGPLTFYVTREQSERWGIEEGRYSMSFSKVMDMLRSGTSIALMMFKPISGTANGALVLALNVVKASAGSIAKRAGVPKEDIDFTLSDLVAANGMWLDHLSKWFTGRKNESKLFNIAKKYRYLTDNYDYRVNKDKLLTGENTIMNQSNLYWFHTIYENWASMTLLGAQMRRQKDKVSGKSLWDLHDDQGNYIGGVRGKIQEKDGSFTELKDLHVNEVSKMKRVSELVHGSYRQEEKIALEAYAFGQWFLQFKRYLPTIVKNLYQSRSVDDSLGRWKAVVDDNGNLVQNEGMDVYEWESMVHEGRVMLALKLAGTTLLQRGDRDEGFLNKDYSWEEFRKDPRQMQNLLTLVSSIAWMVALYSMYAFMAGEDDDDTYWAWRFNRLWKDVSQGINPLDILQPLGEEPVPVISVAYKLLSASGEFIWDGAIWGNRNRDGSIPGWRTIRKHLPVFGGLHQLNNVLEDFGSQLSYWNEPNTYTRR